MTIFQKFKAPSRAAAILACLLFGGSLAFVGTNARAVDDSYRPPADSYAGQSGFDSYSQPPPGGGAYQPPSRGYGDSYQAPPSDSYGAYTGERSPGGGDSTGYGEPYRPPQANGGTGEHYEAVPPDDGASRGTYSEDEIIRAGNDFFGKISGGLASAIEWTFQKAGRPNGYILGQDAGGAFVAGLAYGEGTLYTKDAGNLKVYWQGPSVGYDFGAQGSKVMTLVYNLRDPSDIYNRFGGVEGAAYLVGGVSVQLQKAGHVTLAPIRAGVGLRLGANVGYLKYTRNPTWNPF